LTLTTLFGRIKEGAFSQGVVGKASGRGSNVWSLWGCGREFLCLSGACLFRYLWVYH